MKILDVWINCPSREVAQQIADELIEGRLAACANIFGEVQSVYHWQGAIEREPEVPLLLKTREELFDRVADEVTRLHPYETPPVIGVPVMRVNEDYQRWLLEATAS